MRSFQASTTPPQTSISPGRVTVAPGYGDLLPPPRAEVQAGQGHTADLGQGRDLLQGRPPGQGHVGGDTQAPAAMSWKIPEYHYRILSSFGHLRAFSGAVVQ